ncbi:MAG: hypothetical protein GXX79_12040 [Actinomycetales bacterium]|nr:hypothetical protein [Actinomycetales bacterium]
MSTRSEIGRSVERRAVSGQRQQSRQPVATGRPRLSEALWVTLLGAALSVAMSWPLVRSLSRTVPLNVGDPLYFAWQLSWVGHALRSDPTDIWTTYAFQRSPDNLAFTDTVLGYAPLSLLGSGQDGALLQLNLAGLIATTMSFVGAYALARALGARVPGALVAGSGFAFAPWRLEQVIHINVTSTGGMALALAFLAYGHGWTLRRRERRPGRPGWVLLGWLVACYQLLFGFAIGIPFAYVLAGVLLLWTLCWVFSPRQRMLWWVLLADLVGGAAFIGTTLLLLRPYLRVLEAHPEAKRGESWLWLSPSWRGLITSPRTNVWWGDLQEGWRSTLKWPPEMALLPGFVLLGLAVLGIVLSSWSLRRRLALLLAVAAFAVLALGTRGPGGGEWTYLPLFRNLPGWDALRTPGRLMIWVTLGLCLLAAGTVSKLTDLAWRPWGGARHIGSDEPEDPGDQGDTAPRTAYLGTGGVPVQRGHVAPGPSGLLVRRRSGHRETPRRPPLPAAVALGLLLAVPAAMVTVEGRGDVPNWEIWKPPVALAELPQPILILPSAAVTDYYWMTWQTEGWPVMANGSSGFEPAAQQSLRKQAASFPDTASVTALRERGIRTVILVRDVTPQTPWATAADRPVDGLGIVRKDVGNVIVYSLDASEGADIEETAATDGATESIESADPEETSTPTADPTTTSTGSSD